MGTGERTINQVFRNRAVACARETAVEKKRNGVWEGATWAEYYDRSRAAGLGLYRLGVRKGDRVALLSENRLEWLYTDLGCLGIGGCVVPVYATLTAEEVSYIVGNSGSKVLVVENAAQVAKALQALASCPALEKVVVMEERDAPRCNEKTLGYATLLAEGWLLHEADPSLFETLADAVEPADLATIVYTSGTTGVPKGAMISHGNIMAVIRALDGAEPKLAHEGDRTVPFLPLSHVFERIAGHFYGIKAGITASYAESIGTLLEDFAEKRPTLILAVPRVIEKIYQRIMSQVQEEPRLRQSVFFWGERIGARISELRERRQPVPLRLRLEYRVAYLLIFRKLREFLGGRVRWITASGAPTAEDIIRFFNAAGIMVVQGYGMTECTAPVCIQNLAYYRIGTMGAPLPCNRVKIADDGEILVKGENVSRGYWNMPEETRESFTPEGYFKTGDIGRFDEEGFLRITDRKKDLIITSGGKNVAPQKIETHFLSDPLFEQFVVVGDGRRFLSALVALNDEHALRLARAKGVRSGGVGELVRDGTFREAVQERIDAGNAGLARYETIKKWTILEQPFSQEGGELTPSLKVKRKVVQQKYGDLIETMYQQEKTGWGG